MPSMRPSPDRAITVIARRSEDVAPRYPVTPDGRYFVVCGRLWRRADPTLPEDVRRQLVAELMSARRAVRTARQRGDEAGERQARAAVDVAKIALGERGPVWWTDGAPDLNQHMARTGPYAAWFDNLTNSTPN